MAVSYTIQDNVLKFQFEGSTLSHDLFETVHKAYRDPACPQHANLMMDLMGSLSLPGRSLEGIRTLSEFVIRHPERPGQRIALVLPAEAHARYDALMAELAEESGVRIRMFPTPEAAREWLSERGAAEG